MLLNVEEASKTATHCLLHPWIQGVVDAAGVGASEDAVLPEAPADDSAAVAVVPPTSDGNVAAASGDDGIRAPPAGERAAAGDASHPKENGVSEQPMLDIPASMVTPPVTRMVTRTMSRKRRSGLEGGGSDT